MRLLMHNARKGPKPYSDTPLVKARLKELAYKNEEALIVKESNAIDRLLERVKRKPRIMAAQDREDERRARR